MTAPVEISYLSLPEALQDIFVRQRSGVLRVVVGDRSERFVVLSGELYLSGTNPSRERLERVLLSPPSADDSRFDPREHLRRGLDAVVRDLGDTLASWEQVETRFSEEQGEIPDDIVGPVPTAALVMDLCSRGWTLDDLLRRVGGRSARYRAAEDQRRRQRVPNLDAAELQLLHRLEKPLTLDRLVAGGPDMPAVVCRLVRLAAVGLVEVEVEAGSALSTVSPQVQEKILERVRESLDLEPLTLGPSAHREQLRAMLRDYGRRDYFDLLGVGVGSSTEELHAAFMRQARLAHPVHAEPLGLASQGRKLGWLFSRLTEAYLVLSDPDRAAAYVRGAVVAAAPAPPVDGATRLAERVQLARDAYGAALDYIEERDYFYAIEMLRRAVVMDERAEYYALLGRCQMRNANWLHMAVDSIRRALALRPGDEELRQELAEATRRYRRHQEELAEAAASTASAESRDDARARRLLTRLRREG